MTEESPGKIGPWKYADYRSLTEALSDASHAKPRPDRPLTLSGLMFPQKSQEEAEREEQAALNAATARVKREALYKLLCRDSNFRSARKRFLELTQLPASEHPCTRREFEFLSYSLLWVGLCFLSRPMDIPEKYRKPTKLWADSGTRKSARRLLARLSELRTQGARLTDHREDTTLAALLAKLDNEMSRNRKPYESQATLKTSHVQRLAQLLVPLGITSHYIALDLADLAELGLEESAVRKSYVRGVKALEEQRQRKEHAQRLADALGRIAQ